MRRVLVGALGVLFVLGTVGWALSPFLLVEAPLLLVALSPIARHVLMVAPMVDFLPLLAVVVVRRQLACIVAYFVGETYGEQALWFAERRRPRLSRWMRRVASWFDRASIPLLIVAPNLTALLAGSSRMRFGLFLPASMLGQLWVAVATYYLGDSLRDYIAPAIAFVRDHTASLTLSTVLLVGVRQWLRHRKRLRLQSKQKGSVGDDVR